MNTDYVAALKRVLIAGVMCVAGLLRAAEPATAIVMKTDQARLTAMMAGDGAALARLFSDEVLFTHSDGRVESKADYIKNLTAGDTAYKDVTTTGVQAKPIATDVVVLTGAQQMKKKLGPAWTDISLHFMSVWRNEGGTWRMIAWQSMRPAGNSVVPAPEIRNSKSQTPNKSL